MQFRYAGYDASEDAVFPGDKAPTQILEQPTVPTDKQQKRARVPCRSARPCTDDVNSENMPHTFSFAAPDADKAVIRRSPVTVFGRAHAQNQRNIGRPAISSDKQHLSSTTGQLVLSDGPSPAFQCSTLPRGPCATFGTSLRACTKPVPQKAEVQHSVQSAAAESAALLQPTHAETSPKTQQPASADGQSTASHSIDHCSPCRTSGAEANMSRSELPEHQDDAAFRPSECCAKDKSLDGEAPESCARQPSPARCGLADTGTRAGPTAVAPITPSAAILPKHSSAVFGSAPRWEARPNRPSPGATPDLTAGPPSKHKADTTPGEAS